MYCIHLFKTHSLKAPEKYQKNPFLKRLFYVVDIMKDAYVQTIWNDHKR